MGSYEKDQPKRGRPSGYSEELALTICERLGHGESLRSICASTGMPNKATVFRWIARHKEFRVWYGLAHDCQAEKILADAIEIADGKADGFVERIGTGGRTAMDLGHEILNRRRLRINARLWQVARLAPKKYGL
jgi:hypothetical protein